MKHLLTIFLLAACVSVRVNAGNLVVWDFTNRNGTTDELTRSVTYEFEEALAKGGTYKILERRNFARLQSVIDAEKSLRETGLVSATTVTALKKLGADSVVFGEIFDDIDSGEISITATFQDFQGTKTLIKSVPMPRGRIRDAASRRQTLAALVEAIIGVDATTRSPSGKVGRVESNDYIFDLENCVLSGRAVLCRFTVTNNGEKRDLYLVHEADYGDMAGKWQIHQKMKTVLYDEFNNEAHSVRAQLAGNALQRTDGRILVAKLIPGRPAEATVRFEDVASKATTVSSLELACVDGESGEVFVAEFQNVKLSTK